MLSEKQFGYALGVLLKRELGNKKLGVTEFAKMVGSSRQAIYYFMIGTNRPKGYLLLNMIDALGMDPKDFIAEIKREAKRHE